MKFGCAKRESLLRKVFLRCGHYYQSGELFYQRLWRQRLRQIGFWVNSVEKRDAHHLWDLRLRSTLSAEAYLLLSRPAPKTLLKATDLLEKQLQADIRQIGSEFGVPIPRDSVSVSRHGIYYRVAFLWPKGQPGIWLQATKKSDAFSFLMRPWLRQTRN